MKVGMNCSQRGAQAWDSWKGHTCSSVKKKIRMEKKKEGRGGWKTLKLITKGEWGKFQETSPALQDVLLKEEKPAVVGGRQSDEMADVRRT